MSSVYTTINFYNIKTLEKTWSLWNFQIKLQINGKICTGAKLYIYILGIIEKEGDNLTLFCFFQNGSEGVTKN